MEEIFYYFCFYHIHVGRETYYQHCIIPTTNKEEIKDIQGENHYYQLRTITQIFLTDTDKTLPLIRPLIMDGESLLKKIRKYNSVATNQASN